MIPRIAAFEELIAFAVLVLIVWLIARLVWGGGRRRAPEPPRDEDEALSRLLGQLDRMERRMENLETILMDKEHTTRERQEKESER